MADTDTSTISTRYNTTSSRKSLTLPSTLRKIDEDCFLICRKCGGRRNVSYFSIALAGSQYSKSSKSSSTGKTHDTTFGKHDAKKLRDYILSDFELKKFDLPTSNHPRISPSSSTRSSSGCSYVLRSECHSTFRISFAVSDADAPIVEEDTQESLQAASPATVMGLHHNVSSSQQQFEMSTGSLTPGFENQVAGWDGYPHYEDNRILTLRTNPQPVHELLNAQRQGPCRRSAHRDMYGFMQNVNFLDQFLHDQITSPEDSLLENRIATPLYEDDVSVVSKEDKGKAVLRTLQDPVPASNDASQSSTGFGTNLEAVRWCTCALPVMVKSSQASSQFRHKRSRSPSNAATDQSPTSAPASIARSLTPKPGPEPGLDTSAYYYETGESSKKPSFRNVAKTKLRKIKSTASLQAQETFQSAKRPCQRIVKQLGTLLNIGRNKSPVTNPTSFMGHPYGRLDENGSSVPGEHNSCPVLSEHQVAPSLDDTRAAHFVHPRALNESAQDDEKHDENNDDAHEQNNEKLDASDDEIRDDSAFPLLFQQQQQQQQQQEAGPSSHFTSRAPRRDTPIYLEGQDRVEYNSILRTLRDLNLDRTRPGHILLQVRVDNSQMRNPDAMLRDLLSGAFHPTM